jgi:transcription initiation factor TFIIIB Brf1 subunit/transcription initiation factor TFIIB
MKCPNCHIGEPSEDKRTGEVYCDNCDCLLFDPVEEEEYYREYELYEEYDLLNPQDEVEEDDTPTIH